MLSFSKVSGSTILSHDPPSQTVLPRDLPYRSADEPWHLAAILTECVGKVKPES